MKSSPLAVAVGAALLCVVMCAGSAWGKPRPIVALPFQWSTVVNNNDLMPGAPGERTFNSYNQPSVNINGLVVFRARSRGGPPLGQPTHGIYSRDMFTGGPIVRILDRSTLVPFPNNLDSTFVETPSFPRIDMTSATIAVRGNHKPTWRYSTGIDPGTGEEIETRGGTTGVYTNPFRDLVTAASRLGNVQGFGHFALPAPESPGTPFEVFPGAPAVTNGDTVVFKGNYTGDLAGRTGVYYRRVDSSPSGGNSPVRMIANNTDTLIPGTDTVFGSTSPPSAANGWVVFAGYDNEAAPTLGGIYLAPLKPEPPLTTLVSIGGPVPGEQKGSAFNALGEGGAFDGRHVAFWGAWGEEMKTVRLYCAKEGNKDRIAFCNRNLVCAGSGEIKEDVNSICPEGKGANCYQEREVPVNQGLFVHDTVTDRTWVTAKTGEGFDEFLFWNYSGKTPCAGGGHSEEGAEDDGEPARWRSSAFIAVSGYGSKFVAAFKARSGEFADGLYIDPVDGIYLVDGGPGKTKEPVTLLDTTMDGTAIDPEAPAGSTITELGIEREGLRGRWLAVNASMGIEGGTEEEGMAGIYAVQLVELEEW